MDRFTLAVLKELRRRRAMTRRDIYMRVLRIQLEVTLDGDEDRAVEKCGNAYLMCVGLLEQLQPELKDADTANPGLPQ